MTTNRNHPPKWVLLTCLFLGLCTSTCLGAQRAKTFSEALEMAGDDGIMAYCYGPDWNMRSLRMLQSFWTDNPELDKAAGDAVLVAVPFFQDRSSKDAQEASLIQGRMRAPKLTICPSVLMFDKNGRLYASLLASDFLIRNAEEEKALSILGRKEQIPNPANTKENEDAEQGKLGVHNIAKKLALFRKQQELMKQADAATGQERAALIMQACDLGIEEPEGAAGLITDADPVDANGYYKRINYVALDFMYEQLDTTTGFLKPDFYEDVDKIRDACMEIINDEQLRGEDRQAAYSLYQGAMRRAAEKGSLIRGHIRKSQVIDEETKFGLLSPELAQLWSASLSAAEAREIREKLMKQKAEKAKNQKDDKIRDRRADGNFTIK